MLNETKQYAMVIDYGDHSPRPCGPYTMREDAIKAMDREVERMLRSNPSRRSELNVTSPEVFTIVWASDGCQRVGDSTGAWYVSVREIEPPPIRCTSCDEPAVMLWGSINTETMQISSINGIGYLSPSCAGCGGVVSDDEGTTIQVPLDNLIPFEEGTAADTCDSCGVEFGTFDERTHKHCH